MRTIRFSAVVFVACLSACVGTIEESDPTETEEGGKRDDVGEGPDAGPPDGDGVCRDGTCGDDESCESCPEDCGACETGPRCGDNVCEGVESCSSCSADCGQCPPTDECGDGACTGSEHWSWCSDCEPPPAITWSSIGGCSSSLNVFDAEGDGTWVRADTNQLVVGTCTISNSYVTPDVPGGGGELYLDGAYIATVTCLTSSGGGCMYYWANWDSGNALAITGTCSGGFSISESVYAPPYYCY